MATENAVIKVTDINDYYITSTTPNVCVECLRMPTICFVILSMSRIVLLTGIESIVYIYISYTFSLCI